MKQALLTLARAGSSSVSKKYVVLGGMGELGKESGRLHREVLSVFEQFDEVLLYGKPWIDSTEGLLPQNTKFFDDIEELAQVLKRMVSPGDVVLFKGSRSFMIERVIAILGGAR